MKINWIIQTRVANRKRFEESTGDFLEIVAMIEIRKPFLGAEITTETPCAVALNIPKVPGAQRRRRIPANPFDFPHNLPVTCKTSNNPFLRTENPSKTRHYRDKKTKTLPEKKTGETQEGRRVGNACLCSP